MGYKRQPRGALPKKKPKPDNRPKTIVEYMELSLPTHLILPKKRSKDKKIALNLNWYRNVYFTESNAVKKEFCNLVENKLSPYKFIDPIRLTYVYYNGTKRISDIANICSVVDKFFSDAMVYYKTIEDDNYNFIKEVRFVYGGYRERNPGVDVKISVYEV